VRSQSGSVEEEVGTSDKDYASPEGKLDCFEQSALER
jgi:hypothetical protein